jgi:hypothetical protein
LDLNNPVLDRHVARLYNTALESVRRKQRVSATHIFWGRLSIICARDSNNR